LGCGESLSQRNPEQPIQFFCGLDLKAAAANSKSNSYTSRQRTTWSPRSSLDTSLR